MNSSIWTIWQLWARSADLRNYSAITQLFEEILPPLSQDEIPWDSTSVDKDDPNNKFHLNSHLPIS
jgi:hypothetical protein